MKKHYEAIDLDVIRFAEEDVIATSGEELVPGTETCAENCSGDCPEVQM